MFWLTTLNRRILIQKHYLSVTLFFVTAPQVEAEISMVSGVVRVKPNFSFLCGS
jgi:hypothetical protein